MPDRNTVTYYARRAPQYDQLYIKPERQPDLEQLKSIFKRLFSGLKLLEIACGTGYWTQAIAETAQTVKATDINESMLEIARQKAWPRQNVVFQASDMYHLQPGDDYDALFGGFIWSHIPLEDLGKWLDHLHGLLKPGSRVVFADNRFVPGSNTPVAGTDHYGNMLQQRRLSNGETYMIVKNFPQQTDFENFLSNRGQNIQVTNLEYYWILEYTL